MKPIQDYTRDELITLALAFFSSESLLQDYFEREAKAGRLFSAEEYCAKVVDLIMKTVEPLSKPHPDETTGDKMIRDGTM